MSNEITWIKVSLGLFDDEKIKIIESMPDKDSLLVIWVKLLIQAGKSNAGGYIRLTEQIPYTDEMLASIFGRPLNTIRLAIATFQKFGMIEVNTTSGIFLTNWAKYQNIETLDNIREKTRLRVAKHRLALKEALTNTPSNDTVTLQVTPDNVTVTQEKEIEKENKIENREKEGDKGVEGDKPLLSVFVLPEWIDKKIWDNYLESRKKLKVPPTENAKGLLVKELERLKDDGDDPNEVLNQSIMKSWRGVFPLKKNYSAQKESLDIPIKGLTIVK